MNIAMWKTDAHGVHKTYPQTRASVGKSLRSIIGATDMRQGLGVDSTEKQKNKEKERIIRERRTNQGDAGTAAPTQCGHQPRLEESEEFVDPSYLG